MNVQDEIKQIINRLEHSSSPSLLDWVSMLNIYERNYKYLDSNVIHMIENTNEKCRLYWNKDRKKQINGITKYYKGLNIKSKDILPKIK